MFCTSEKQWEELKTTFKTQLDTELKIDANLSNTGDNMSDMADKAEDFRKILLSSIWEHPIGTGLSYFFGLLRDGLGDSLQRIIHNITFPDADMVYTYEELSTEGAKTSEYNDYTNVRKYEKDGITDEKNQKIINISKINSNETEDKRFSDKTEIPIIMIDLYNIAVDNVPIFDINFLTVNEEKHPEGSPWRNLRNFITAFIHIIIFMVAAFLVLMLIFNGIQIVRHSLDNPEAKAKYKNGIERFGTSLLMLVGSVVIMALCIYGSNMFLEGIKVNSSKGEFANEGPLRVNVEEAGYSFSTNITGFFRYMADIEGINRCLEKGAYTIGYIVLSVVNFILTVLMILRMLGIMGLAAVGPIIAGLYAMNVKSPLKYSNWIRLCVCLSVVQVILVIAYQIIFGLTIPNITNI